MKQLKIYLLMVGCSTLLAFGIYNVHSQSNITEGGILGAILLIENWFNISPAFSGVVLDLTCFAIGIKVFGKGFAKNALVCTLSFSIAYKILESFPPLIPNLSSMPILAAIIGAIFVGVGVGPVVKNGGAVGGDDALALVISTKLKIKISYAYIFTDSVVLLLSLTYISLDKILYSLLTVTLSSFIIGLFQKK